MSKLLKSVTHRSVGNRKPKKDISQEPEMQRLKELFSSMTDQEKERTLDQVSGSPLTEKVGGSRGGNGSFGASG